MPDDVMVAVGKGEFIQLFRKTTFQGERTLQRARRRIREMYSVRGSGSCMMLYTSSWPITKHASNKVSLHRGLLFCQPQQQQQCEQRTNDFVDRVSELQEQQPAGRQQKRRVREIDSHSPGFATLILFFPGSSCCFCRLQLLEHISFSRKFRGVPQYKRVFPLRGGGGG